LLHLFLAHEGIHKAEGNCLAACTRFQLPISQASECIARLQSRESSAREAGRLTDWASYSSELQNESVKVHSSWTETVADSMLTGQSECSCRARSPQESQDEGKGLNHPSASNLSRAINYTEVSRVPVHSERNSVSWASLGI
jgi:hypothetical protein